MTKNCLSGLAGILRLFLTAVLWLSFLPSVQSEDLDQEFKFASGLVGIGFPDFAEKVVQKVVRLHPDQKDRARLIQAEILISRHKFDDAQKLVDEMGAKNPKAQAISLALAKGYYAVGDTDKAEKLYNNFFKQYAGRVPTDPDLLRFYQDSAYQFGQMLEMSGDLDGAIKAYRRVLATKPDKNTERRLRVKQAELYVKSAENASLDKQSRNLAEAKKICEDIQWGGIDIWFGQSVITLAHIELVQGNKKEAQKILTSNMDIFKEIDQFLKEAGLSMSVSPMAGARFLLGELFKDDADYLAKKKGHEADAVKKYGQSLTEFYNVFAKYGDSEWGQQAGVRAGEVKAILEDRYGKKVRVDLGNNVSKAVGAYFRLADNLYRQKKYREAAKEYIKTLNQFPETDATPGALANLIRSYVELNDPLMVKMLITYTGERFAGNDKAAVALLLVAKDYYDKKDEPMYMLAYDTYLEHFPRHEKAAAVLFTLAGMKKKAGDRTAATKYFDRIVENYPDDKYYPKALSQMAWGYYLTTNMEKAVAGFQVYLKEAQPSPAKARAQFALADAYRQLGNLNQARIEYGKLVKWLAPKNNPYGTSAADVKKNKSLLEKSVFQLGYCYARMNEPPEAIPEYRKKAISTYSQFVKLFPKSDAAPAAMNMKGTVQLDLGAYDAATKTFDELAEKYPNSEEGKSALFSLTRSAMEIKRYEQAKVAFKKILADSGNYGPDEFARIGSAMIDAGMYPEAIEAFNQVTGRTEDRKLLERSLYGLGQAYYEQKDYEQAVSSLEELMKRYPKSGLFYDAKFTLARAYRETGRLDEAMKAMSDVLKYADTPLLVTQATYDLGMIQKEQDDQQGAFASFFRISLLANPEDKALRPLIEKSLLESIALGMEMGRYQDVQDNCDQYLQVFPDSDRIADIRKAKADAKLKASTAPAPVSVEPSEE